VVPGERESLIVKSAMGAVARQRRKRLSSRATQKIGRRTSPT
jgi:hypothetical protein